MDKQPEILPDLTNPENLVANFSAFRSNVYRVMRDTNYVAPAASLRPVKNILVYTDHANWHTGHHAAVCSLTEQLNEYGYNAILGLCKKPPAEAVPEGVKLVVNRIIGTTDEGFRQRMQSFRKIVEENDIDTVILNSWQGSYKFWDMLILQNLFPDEPEKRVRVLLHFHSSFAKPQFELGSNWLRLNTEAVKHFDGLLVNNEVDAVFWRTYNTRVYYRPLPIQDVPDIQEESLPKTNDVIYVARFSGVKNQLAAINAFQHVAAELPEAKLVLAGDDHDGYQEKCRVRVAELGLEDNVEILGFVAGEEKDRLFRTARCAVNTSRFEGFSQYLCEAKAYSLPVVAYSLPNLTVLDGAEANGAVIVPKDNPMKLGDALVRVLKDPALQEQLGKAGRAHFEELASFDYQEFWKNVFEDMRTEKPPLEEWTTQQKIYASLFDALLTASRDRDKKKGPVAALKRAYRKGPDSLKTAYRNLREKAYKATH